jgi:uncharacterized protein
MFHFHYTCRVGGGNKMKILIAGSTGLVGSSLVTLLNEQGHTVTRLVRPTSIHKSSTDSIVKWDPLASKIDSENLDGFDAVVNLAGENLVSGRWTRRKKAELRDSRINGTLLLSDALAKLKKRPPVLISASAIGYYGDRGEEALTEEASKGSGFLADLCQDWESATRPAVTAGIRVVNLRIGVVLSSKGGALSKMLLPFQWGAGGEIGSGDQYFSWIAIDDVTGAILHAIHEATLSGPVNATAPRPVTNREFTKALGKVLVRPTLIPVPNFGLRMLFGEMADECLLSGQNVVPSKLESSGYNFLEPEIEPALRHILKN